MVELNTEKMNTLPDAEIVEVEDTNNWSAQMDIIDILTRIAGNPSNVIVELKEGLKISANIIVQFNNLRDELLSAGFDLVYNNVPKHLKQYLKQSKSKWDR